MIKKTLIVVSLFISMHSFAQLNKNRIMISGRGNLYTDKQERETNLNQVPLKNTEKITDGNVNLNVGYFLSNNFAIGGILGFGKNTTKQTSQFIGGGTSIEKNTTQNYSTGVFLRYNHMIRESKFGLFFQFNNTYGWGKLDTEKQYLYPNNPNPDPNKSQEKGYLFRIGLTPGLMYFITNRLSIETSIGDLSYNSSVSRDTPQELQIDKQSQFNADFSMATVYFGLTFYLGGQKSEAAKTSGN